MPRLIDAIIGQSRDKMDKEAVLYVHKQNTEYQCRQCIMLYRQTNRCSIHGNKDVIMPYGSCGFWVKGRPEDSGRSIGAVDKTESGYTESKPGFSCKRCRNFNPAAKTCAKVNEFSAGDDYGMIHEDACCNSWEALEEYEME